MISGIVTQMSFRVETRGVVANFRLFSQVIKMREMRNENEINVNKQATSLIFFPK